MATEDSPSPKIPYPEWQNEYQAALVELNREKLPGAGRGLRDRDFQSASGDITKL